MLKLINCSNCHKPLQLPPGTRSIRCVLCHAITNVPDPRSVLSPSPLPHSSNTQHHHHRTPPPAMVPSPRHHGVPGPPPSVHGRKRAVICGVSYKNTRHELKGCINDAKCMKYLLVNRFKFPESSIIMLTGTSFFFCSIGLILMFKLLITS